jgi:hypothetical protein
LNKQESNKNKYAIGFAITGSLLTIAFFALVNYTTGSRFPWFIFPSFAVLWWPLSIIFAGRHAMKAFSLAGSFIVIAFVFILNYTTSWGYPWFIYPAFAVLWWPLSLFLANPRTIKAYSIAGALIILAYLATINIVFSSFYPWTLYAVYPVLMWPVCVFLGKRTGRLPAAILCSAVGIACYAALNVLLAPAFPWTIFIAYALLWWPVSVAFAKRGHLMIFSLCGALLSSALFIMVNIVTTPHNIWAVYPIFAFIWWPLVTYYFIYRRNKNLMEQ